MANPAQPGVVRRVALSYATDLLVAFTLVLALGRLLLPAGDSFDSNPILPGSLHAAIARLTPFGLWEAYHNTLLATLRDFSHLSVDGPLSSTLLGIRMLLVFLLAAPNALLTVYEQSEGADAWMSLVAWAVTAIAFVLLLISARPSPARLILAIMFAPLLASVLFWLAQETLLDAMDGVNWFARMTPWLLPCPVVCTLWWVCFPRATRGATASLVLFLQQRLAVRTRAGSSGPYKRAAAFIERTERLL